jgi:MFS family permease
MRGPRHRQYNHSVNTWLRKLAIVQPLRLRRFRVVWIGETVSMLGDQFYLVALPWLTLELTGSTLALGLVLMAAAIPRAGLMLVGGALSDRIQPRSVMMASSAARALLVGLLALLVWTDAIQLWHLYLLGALFGAADAFFQPAALALIPAMVGKERLEASNALVTGSMAITGMLGPAVAGVAVGVAGAALGFGIDALTFAFAAVTAFSIGRRSLREADDRRKAPERTFAAIGEGLRYALGDPQIRTVLLAVLVINMAVVGPFFVGLPALVGSFSGGATDYGLVLSAWGAAALAGAVLAGTLGARIPISSLVPGTALAMAAALMLMGVAPNALFAALASTPLGGAVGMLQVSGMAWLQRRSDPAMQGRLMSLVMLAIMGLTPASYVLAGAAAEAGPTLLFLVSGVSVLLLALLTHRAASLRASEAECGGVLESADPC